MWMDKDQNGRMTIMDIRIDEAMLLKDAAGLLLDRIEERWNAMTPEAQSLNWTKIQHEREVETLKRLNQAINLYFPMVRKIRRQWVRWETDRLCAASSDIPRIV